MKTGFVIIAVAFSCMVSEVWSAPFTNLQNLGAAVGAFKGALDGAAAANMKPSFFNIGDLIKSIGSKAFSAVANNSFFQDLAKKAAVQGATLSAGVVIGAAAASKKQKLKHKPLIEHHEAPILQHSNPGYHGDHQVESAPVESPAYHLQSSEFYGELGAHRQAAHTAFLHPQEYADGIYR